MLSQWKKTITNLINSVDEALELVRNLHSERVKMLFDTYHASSEEENIYEAIDRALRYIGHVHVADDDRNIPGMGNLNWKEIMHRLNRGGYLGYLSLEAKIESNAPLALKKTIEFLKAMEGY